jgi:hypothetical protein
LPVVSTNAVKALFSSIPDSLLKRKAAHSYQHYLAPINPIEPPKKRGKSGLQEGDDFVTFHNKICATSNVMIDVEMDARATEYHLSDDPLLCDQVDGVCVLSKLHGLFLQASTCPCSKIGGCKKSCTGACKRFFMYKAAATELEYINRKKLPSCVTKEITHQFGESLTGFISK